MIKISALIKRIIYSIGLFILSAPIAFAEGEESRHCESFASYFDDSTAKQFLLQDAILIAGDACDRIAKKTWDTFAQPLQGIMALGVGIYIAVYTLRNIGSFSKQDVGGYLSNEKTGIIPLLVKSAFIIFLLSDQDFVYKYLVTPIISSGIDVGRLLFTNYQWKSNFSKAEDLLDMFKEIVRLGQNFNDQIYHVVAMGRLMLCLAFLPTVFINWYWVLIPLGFTLYVFGWLLSISFSFYLLDLLIRLSVGCLVLPFAIACGISKFTATYTKKTWDIFVNTAFNFIVLGVVVAVTIQMIHTCVGGGLNFDGFKATVFNVFIGEAKRNAILTVADAAYISQNIGVMTFVLVAMCCMIAMKMFFSVETMASQLSATTTMAQDKGIGAQVGKQLVQDGTKAAKEPVKDVAKATGAEVKDTIANTELGHKIGIT